LLSELASSAVYILQPEVQHKQMWIGTHRRRSSTL